MTAAQPRLSERELSEIAEHIERLGPALFIARPTGEIARLLAEVRALRAVEAAAREVVALTGPFSRTPHMDDLERALEGVTS